MKRNYDLLWRGQLYYNLKQQSKEKKCTASDFTWATGLRKAKMHPLCSFQPT